MTSVDRRMMPRLVSRVFFVAIRVAALPIVLLITLVYSLTLAVAVVFFQLSNFWPALVLTGPLIWLSVVDLRFHIIPDAANAMIAAIGLWLVWQDRLDFAAIDLIGALVLLACFWALGAAYYRRHGHEALGIGDAKLIAASSLVLGIVEIWVALVLASVGGICATLFMQKKNAHAVRSAVPFGPFLAYGVFLTFLMPQVI